MDNFIAETVADLTDKASDVGNKGAALQAQKILQEQKDRIDSQLADEIVALKQSGEASSDAYRKLLGETTALSTAINAAKTDAQVAAIKEERLDLANLAPQGGERLIAQADAQIYSKIRGGLDEAKKGFRSHLNFELPLPAIKQDRATGKNKVFPVKAAAPAGENETSIEASYMAYEAALRNDFRANATGSGAGNFIIPSLVVDLIGYIVKYPRLYNKFRVYQTPGVSPLTVNRITGINPAPIISTAGVPTGERQQINPNNVTTSNVTFNALKVAGLTRITPELLRTLPADMLQTQIATYLADSIGLRFARDAVNGPGGAVRGDGVVQYLTTNKADVAGGVRFVTKKGALDAGTIKRETVTSLFAAVGGAYQSIAGGLTLAMHSGTFWSVWSAIQDSYPLFSDTRSFDTPRLGPWMVCVDDEFAAKPDEDNEFANNSVPIVAGDFMRAWGIRYGGALQLSVSYEEAFTTDQITIKAVQHFDTKPLELPAVAALQVQT